MTISKIVRKVRRAIFLDEPGYYDMFENKGEIFFGQLYLQEIFRILDLAKVNGSLKILDAGCQTGRLSIPLAKAGHQVTGVDTSAVALHRARQHAQAQGVSLQLMKANLTQWLPKQPSKFFDAVVCTEVLYMRDNYRMLLEHLLRILRPGGLCFISHRPAAYYLVEAFQKKDWEAVHLVRTQKEGVLFGSYYNWQDRDDLETLYRELGIEPLAITSIGFLSWLVTNPETLDKEDRELLFEIETDKRSRENIGGRYLLVSGWKK